VLEDIFNALNAPDHSLQCAELKAYKFPYLNGGLFERDTLDDKNIVLPASLFNDMFELFNQYNFTVDENTPNDTEISVDPEMLGRIFENLLEDNKDKGAFYTPKEIVQYMCQQSLIEYLKTHLEDNAEIETFIKTNYIDHGNRESYIVKNAKRIEELLDALKICDPAIGSGAFPMGILHEIYRAKLVLNPVLDALETKKAIIQNSIYGVDIEQGAVDIARLRFWLSLVVEETIPQALPNLDYKIMCGDSLINRFPIDCDIKEVFKDYNQNKPKTEQITIEKYRELTNTYLNEHEQKDAARSKIEEIKNALKTELSKGDIKKIATARAAVESFENYNLMGERRADSHKKEYKAAKDKLQKLEKNREDTFNNTIFSNSFEWRFEFPSLLDQNGEFIGFDIVIGNPPYVSTKGVNENDKKIFEKLFGFADDLYFHFIIKGFDLLKLNGINTMITPDTYFTTLTKKQLRFKFTTNNLLSLIHLGHDVFDEAMVSTAIFVCQKNEDITENKSINVIDAKGKKKLIDASYFNIPQSVYRESINGSFFVPNDINLQIHNKLGKTHKDLIESYWDKICTSTNIKKNAVSLKKYRDSLVPGEFTLVGLVTEGGQGLATANNGKYVGVKEGTKEANRIRATRPQKLQELNNKLGTNYKMPDSEVDIVTLFDEIKEKYGRDSFGQGYLHRIVTPDIIANVDTLSDTEKLNGIDNTNATYVPYDKGDKDGNRWYLPTPYYINWNKLNVSLLKTDKKARFQNTQFYFREGFCWIDVNSTYLKCRLKSNSVHDVMSMSLFSMCDKIPEFYIVSIINSSFISELVQSFLNTTSHFQINDCRALPIPVPTSEQLNDCKKLFDKAYSIQYSFFEETISSSERDKQLSIVQKEVDDFVKQLYGF